MLNETPLIKFIALITFDRDYASMSAHIVALQKEITLLHAQENELDATITVSDSGIRSMKKEIDADELLIASLDQQIKEKKERLAAAMNPREHRAIMSEIDSINTQQLAAEERLLNSWTALETRKRGHDKLLLANQEQKQRIATAIAEKQQQMADEITTQATTAARRASYEQGVPEQWLEKYAAMRSRVPNPVVPIEQDSCSACFHGLSHQELVQLRRRALLECKSCYRFLYCPIAHQL
ncbi:hypothetical protein JST99_01115 [Candidatus Dependentiae bacterium]|nr:hypothetical protein [Candidatus Dependentiae bacterium]MCC7415017.1 hypothetical protein [Campylobacterota bacterium]